VVANLLGVGVAHGEKLIHDFSRDIKAVHEHIVAEGHAVGDFGFTHEGHGTRFDAFVVIGDSLYLLWNNTGASTTQTTKNPSWKIAQTEFLAFTDVIRSNPVAL